jgi:hypothetical protein
MNVIELLETMTLLEERSENSLLLLDIDDTLLKAQGIKIYRKLPSDKKEVALTPDQYAKDPNASKKENHQYYDYRDFRNADKVSSSIKTGLPIIPNLKVMDDYIKRGWKIGILTARGMEDIIFDSMKTFLKYRDAKGNLKPIGDKLVRDLVHAISTDEGKKLDRYPGESIFEKKVNVIKKLAKKFNQIIFVDDDLRNVKAVKKIKIPNVMVKYATAKAGE